MCGGWLLEWSHSAGWFTGSFDRYKALILLSVVHRYGFTLLLVPRMPADGEGTLRDAIRFVLHPKKIVRQ